MASQVCHIIYAKRYLDKNPNSEIEKDHFYLGCIFPDIRQIEKRLKRSETHMRFPIINLDFSGLNSFEAGWKFHLYCDMRRDEIMRNAKFYDLKNNHKESWTRPAKLLEDELIYDQYNNWEKIIALCNNPPYIEMGLNIPVENYNIWYAMVAKYFEKKPDSRTMRVFLNKLDSYGFPLDVDRIIAVKEKIAKNEKATHILTQILDEIA